jgi:chromosomal replication initiation ATPase DnaA
MKLCSQFETRLHQAEQEWKSAILSAVSNVTGVPIIAILGKCRLEHIADARQMVQAIAYERVGGYNRVAKLLGVHDTNVIHSVRAARDKSETEASFRTRMDLIRQKLGLVEYNP